jgi:hypothetical protein
VIAEIERQDKLDNRLIIWLQGDSGNSAEGTVGGTANALAATEEGMNQSPGVVSFTRRDSITYNVSLADAVLSWGKQHHPRCFGKTPSLHCYSSLSAHPGYPRIRREPQNRRTEKTVTAEQVYGAGCNVKDFGCVDRVIVITNEWRVTGTMQPLLSGDVNSCR